MNIGDKGQNVLEVQNYLKTLGYYTGRLDGDFGPLTRKAVEDFKRSYLVTGIVDEHTYKLLKNKYDIYNKNKNKLIVPHGMNEVEQVFGVIKYEDVIGGRIKITNGWARHNMTKTNLPIVGNKWIHRLVVPIFTEALFEVKKANLSEEIEQFGTWNPRHKWHNPGKPLSLHSWGIACDINWSDNPAGKPYQLHEGIINIFESFGFIWGGRWKHTDPMHFQYASGC